MTTHKAHVLKLTLVILFLFSFTSNILGQELRLVDNKGTLKTVINNTVTTGTAPANPLENDIWFDTATSTIIIWNQTNNTWIPFSNIYNSDGILTNDRTVDMEDKNLVFFSDQDTKSTLTIRRADNNTQESGIAFGNTGQRFLAAIVMGAEVTGDLEFYSGGRDNDIDLLGKTLSLHDDNQIEFS